MRLSTLAPVHRSTALATALLALVLLAASVGAPALAQIPDLGGGEPAAPAGDEATAPVPAATDAAADRAIQRRLEGIFANVDGLDGVRVEVHSGVVELSGEVLTLETREKAVRLARQVEGVIEVEDRITEVRDVGRRLAPALSSLEARLSTAIGYLPLVAVALLVLALAALLARWVGSWERPFRHLARNHFLRDLLRRAISAAIFVAGALAALEILDATALVGAVLGAAGLVGLALGFAFRDTAENYIASVLLSLRQPFAPNDHVEIGGHAGRVIRLTSRATVLMTLDGNHLRIPNSTVFRAVILNYTRNPRRRFDFKVGVGTDSDLVQALELGGATLLRMEGVLGDPPPQGWIDTLGDSAVVLTFVGWVDQRRADFTKVRSEAIRRIKEAFDAAGLDMPEPIYRLRMEGVAPAPAPTTSPAPPPGREEEEEEEEEASDAEPTTDRAEIDISPDAHLDREIAADRAASTENDLLDPTAPKE